MEYLPVSAAPIVCPTAEPMATPPAVAAICPNKPGWRPWGAITGAGADGGGRARARVGGGGGLEEKYLQKQS